MLDANRKISTRSRDRNLYSWLTNYVENVKKKWNVTIESNFTEIRLEFEITWSFELTQLIAKKKIEIK